MVAPPSGYSHCRKVQTNCVPRGPDPGEGIGSAPLRPVGMPLPGAARDMISIEHMNQRVATARDYNWRAFSYWRLQGVAP